MATEICIKSFASGSTIVRAGDQGDSATAIVSNNSAFWELVTPASSSIAKVSFAYGTQIICRGDVFTSASAVVVAAPSYFVTCDGSAAAVAIREERLGTHR
jgi:hypothetical protein